MLDRCTGSMITVAIAAAAVGAVVSASVTRTSGRRRRRGPARIERQAQLQRHLAGQQRSQLGPAGARGAARRRHAAGRLSLRLRAGAGGAGARARRRRRRAGLARRRAGRRADSLQARSAGDEEGERRALDRPRPGAQVLPAGHSARDVHALSVPDHAEHQQDPLRLRVLEHGAHDPSGQGRRRRPTTPGWATRSGAGKATRWWST